MIKYCVKCFSGYGRLVLIGFSSGVLLVGVFILHMLAAHNFHVVSLGQVYRSGQLSGKGLSAVIQEHGIKSILNLRGADGAEWYSSETNISRQLGVAHIDYELSAARELENEEMEKILAMIGKAPKPILIHCKSGADRTGLVGALYLYSFEGKSAEIAESQLTVLKGHLPYLFWRDTIAMDRSFRRYVNSHAPSIGRVSNPLAARDELAPVQVIVAN